MAPGPDVPATAMSEGGESRNCGILEWFGLEETSNLIIFHTFHYPRVLQVSLGYFQGWRDVGAAPHKETQTWVDAGGDPSRECCNDIPAVIFQIITMSDV